MLNIGLDLLYSIKFSNAFAISRKEDLFNTGTAVTDLDPSTEVQGQLSGSSSMSG